MQEAEHHGDRWFKEAVDQGKLRETIKAVTDAAKALGTPIGATRTFPDGAITPDDEGQVRIAITHQGGKVILAFGKPMAWIGLNPREARGLADLLNSHASEA